MRSIKRQRGFIGALISGAASLLGGGISNAQSASRLEDTHRHQNEAQINANAFNERMASTAHQREVADLAAAGLNPILSGTGGKGSVVGSASGSSGAFSPASDVVTPAVMTAMQARRNEAEVDNLKMDTDKKREEKHKAYRETHNLEEIHKLLVNQVKGSNLEGEIDETKYGAVMRYIDRAMRSVLGGSSAIRNVTPK